MERPPQSSSISDIPEKEPEPFIAKPLRHLALFQFVSRQNDQSFDFLVEQESGHGVAERTGASGNEDVHHVYGSARWVLLKEFANSWVLDGKPLALVPMVLRPVSTGDCWFLYELSHDPSVRANSLSPYPPKWEDHKKWLTSLVESSEKIGFVIEYHGESVGLVRAEREQNHVKMSIAVRSGWRGIGLGTFGITKMAERAKTFGVPLRAEVKMDNDASLRLFERCGFTMVGARSPDILILEAA